MPSSTTSWQKSASLHKPDLATAQRIQHSYGQLPLSFEANAGQTASPVKFLSRGRGYNLFLTPTEAVLALQKLAGTHGSQQAGSARPKAATSAVLRMQLVGANRVPQISGAQELSSKSNYFIGRNPRQWHTNVAHYARVNYPQIYKGIDLVYYGNQQQLEYDFQVAPGANPNAIKLGFKGAKNIHVNKHGDLVLDTGNGQVIQHAPVVYQKIGGVKKAIDSRYELRGNREVGFHLAAYDPQHPVTIDPILYYATYIGGAANDFANAIAVDASGNAYITGGTTGAGYPVKDFSVTRPAFQNASGGGRDVFVTKLNATGTALIYSTYLGGSADENGNGIAVDGSGNAYITGYTLSPNFPTRFPYQATGTANVSEAFVTELNATGSALVFSTYLGGNAGPTGTTGIGTIGNAIALDSSNNVYVAGATSATNFPTVSGYQSAPVGGASDGFVAKLNFGFPIYSTYLGGTGDDRITGIAVDSANRAVVCGSTTSTNFPVKLAYQSSLNLGFGTTSTDAFVTKLSSSGQGLFFSTYLGGSGADAAAGVAVDNADDVYVTGSTASAFDFPVTAGVVQTFSSGGTDAFVTKIPGTGGTATYSTYLGGSGNDVGVGIQVDSLGRAYVAGNTVSNDFPTRGAIQAARSGPTSTFRDAFLTVLNPTASAYMYSTYYGGTNEEIVGGLALDSAGNAYIAGSTFSADFPATPGAYQIAQSSATNEAFVFKVGPPITSIAVTTAADTTGGPATSLRDAITTANANPGASIIFNIPTSDAGFSGGVFTLQPTSALPAITADSTTINGASQTGFSGDTNTSGPEIVLNGSLSAGADGLTLNSFNGNISGLVINGFAHGINIDGQAGSTFGNVVQGNYLGTDATGTTAVPNSASGIIIQNSAQSNTIGGLTAATRNIISGNGADGVIITGSNTTGNAVLGNYIGLQANGNTALGNGTGILISGGAFANPGSTISGNIISGNTGSGINLTTTSARNSVVQGNSIGTNAAGTAAVPNGGDGIFVDTGAAINTIGGISAGQSNLIANNGQDGIGVQGNTTTRNSIRGNVFLNNGGLGINLQTAGESFNVVTNNDLGDGDSGGNTLQNYPVITDARSINGSSPIIGTLNSTANATFTLDFYSISTPDPSGHGEAQTYLGAQNVSTDGSGNASFNFTYSGDLTGKYVTATATTANGNTSEFAANFQVISPVLTLSVTPNSFSEAAGPGVATGTVTRNTPNGAALTVNLFSNISGKVSFPATVTIPANQNSVTFSIDAIDNSIVDGDQTVVIVASQTGFTTGTASVTVTDDDVPTLSLTINPNIFSEAGGSNAATGTVTRNTLTNTAQTVNLSNSDPNSAQVPTTVTIPVGAASVNFSIGGIDNSVVDGSRSITITATAPNFIQASAQATVVDNDGPTLSLSVSPKTFSEAAGAGAATGTVSRNTPTTAALTVDLSSSNSKVQVPATVTIPVGAASVTFPINAIDDAVASGPQAVTLAANAANFNPGLAIVNVTDNDVPTLTIAVTPNSFIEGATNIVGTVTRNTPNAQAMVVTLTSSNPSRLRLPDTITIPAGANTTQFTVTPVDDTIANGNATITLTATAGSLTNKTTVTVVDNDSPALAVTINPGAISEAGGVATGTITRNFALTTDLVVNLSSSNTGATTVPATVTIPAGATSATFPVTAVDDTIAEGNRSVTITATTSNLSSTATVTVVDNETPALTLSLVPAVISETGGKINATLTRNTPTDAPLTVYLTKNIAENRLRLPVSVTIPAGTASFSFTIPVVDNTIVDGTQSITITATAGGLSSAVASVTITDNEIPSLTLTVNRNRFPENAGAHAARGTVTRNSPTTAALRVALSSDDRNKLRVPTSVLIPAKAKSVSFDIQAVNDGVAAGPRLVNITASATGFRPGTAAIVVTDVAPASSLSLAGRVTATTATGNVGIAGVTVTLDSLNLILDITTTDRSGNYVFTHLPSSTYRVAVSKPQYTFKPTSIRLDLNNSVRDVNFLASPVPVIAGSVTQHKSDGTVVGVAGVVITARGAGTVLTAKTDTNGVYTLKPKVVGSYSLVATKTNAKFTPASKPVSLTVTSPAATNINFTLNSVSTGTATSSGSSTPAAQVTRSSVALSTGSANAATNSVQLRFTGALDAEAASDPTHYTVEVNGKSVTVDSTSYNATSHTVVLALESGALQIGDHVAVSWNDVTDAKGATLNGQSNTIVAH
ncbi:MAG: SBBP repeat-containing protein [Abitibacteriaceae bacterium]|nr:SBBP repeat-containing protein [Abditibacteriaceae bacterium]